MVDMGTLAPNRHDDFFDLLITAELPGVDGKDVEVTVSGDTLTIWAEKKVEREETGDDGCYLERRSALISRSLRLPFEMKDEEMHGTFDKGVLTIRVRKVPEEQKTLRRIDVKRTRSGRA